MSDKITAEAKPTLAQKILAIQLNLKAVEKKEKGYGYNYYDINQLIAELKPLLTKHGLLVMQPLSHIDNDPALKTIVMSGDERMEWDVPLPLCTTTTVETKKNKDGSPKEVTTTEEDPQRTGASITYFRRYALASLFLLEAEDTDANKVEKPF